MAISLSDLMFVHSGGAANTSPAADLGGAISTAGNKRIKSQTATGLSNITGCVINDAFGNAEGVGVLAFTQSTRKLSWKPYGESAFYGSVVTTGVWLIGSSSGYLLVTIADQSNLPLQDKQDGITVANILENVFDQVTAAQAMAGKTSYRCCYILNNNGSAQTANNVTIWLASNTPAGDDIWIGNGTASAGAIEQTIVNELTAPTGVNWLQPVSKSTGINIGNIAPGSYKSIWQKRVVPVMTRGSVVANAAVIAVSADV